MELNEITCRLPPHLMQFVIEQPYYNYTPVDQAVWRYVMRKNLHHLRKVAHESYVSGLKITGIDLSPNMIRLAEINNPGANFQIMDCRKIEKINKRYDAIICGFCLPYLSKPEVEKLVRDISILMNTNAVLYLSTIEDKHEHSTFKTGSTGDQVFQYYYEAGYLSGLLKENNIEIIDLVRYGSREIDPATDIDLVIIARKK